MAQSLPKRNSIIKECEASPLEIGGLCRIWDNEKHEWLTVGDNIDKWHREEEARRGRIVVEQNGVIIARYRNQREASMELGVSQGKISLVLNGRRKTAGGYRFYYEE